MKKRILSTILVIMVLVATVPLSTTNADIGVTSTNTTTVGDQNAKYIFYFIGDGLGAAQRQLAEYYLQTTTGDSSTKLLMNDLEYSAINTTHSANTLVTDSAAAGTALATGYKTNNGMISVLEDGSPVETLVEKAESIGMATGVATTTRITHATPAVFISHNADRDNESDIAADMLDSGVDYLVGGGVRHFLPQNFVDTQTDVFGSTIKSKRTDDRNLLSEFAALGYTVDYGLSGAENFENYNPKTGDQYVGLFAYSHMPYSIDVENQTEYDVPTLAEITEKGIELLSKDEDGFFFMIEAGRIDHACHPNDAAGTIMDTLALDDAIKEAYTFYEAHPDETLIVVVGDHETGGLGMGVNTDYFMNLQELSKVTVSIEDWMYGDVALEGNLDTIMSDAKTSFGIESFTDSEKAMLQSAITRRDAGIISEGNAYAYNEVAVAMTHIVSEHAGVYWTSFAHTGTQIPLSAIGVGAENYKGFLDNTDIEKITANLLGFDS